MEISTRTRIGAALGFLLATAFAPRQDAEPILRISCEEAVSGAFGNAQLYATLSPEGEISHYTLVWEMRPQRWGAWLTGTWALGRSPGVPDDNGSVSLFFATAETDVGEVRIEVWRRGERPGGDMSFSGNYMRVYRSQPTAPFARSSHTRWGEIRALLADGAARVVMTERRGFWVAQDRLDPSVAAMPAAAVAAARERLAGRVADYRNACRPYRQSDLLS